MKQAPQPAKKLNNELVNVSTQRIKEKTKKIYSKMEAKTKMGE